jgi:hypothetical protein
MNLAAVRLIRSSFIVVGLLAFVGLYVYFFIEIWGVDGNVPPDLDKQLVYAASLVGGVLGTFFAIALGVQRKDPDTDQKKLNLGPTLVGEGGKVSVILANTALILYTLVGVAAVVTAFAKSTQSPDAIKALAATFGGYAFAVFAGAFGGSPPPPPPPPPPAPSGVPAAAGNPPGA